MSPRRNSEPSEEFRRPPKGFPCQRRRLASRKRILAFLEHWKPIFVEGTGAIEDPSFPEALWALGFVYQGNALTAACFAYPRPELEKIQTADDILLVGDAIFAIWRHMTHGLYGISREQYGAFLVLFDRLQALATPPPRKRVRRIVP